MESKQSQHATKHQKLFFCSTRLLQPGQGLGSSGSHHRGHFSTRQRCLSTNELTKLQETMFANSGINSCVWFPAALARDFLCDDSTVRGRFGDLNVIPLTSALSRNAFSKLMCFQSDTIHFPGSLRQEFHCKFTPTLSQGICVTRNHEQIFQLKKSIARSEAGASTAKRGGGRHSRYHSPERLQVVPEVLGRPRRHLGALQRTRGANEADPKPAAAHSAKHCSRAQQSGPIQNE